MGVEADGEEGRACGRECAVIVPVDLGGIHRISHTVCVAVGGICNGTGLRGLGQDWVVGKVKLGTCLRCGGHTRGSGYRGRRLMMERGSRLGFVVTKAVGAVERGRGGNEHACEVSVGRD